MKIFLLVLLLPVWIGAQTQNPTRPRPVATLPATPCSPRDFVQAADTGTVSVCASDGQTWGSLGGGNSLPVADSTAVVKGSSDSTKLVRLEADLLTTATTRVLTMADRDIDLSLYPKAVSDIAG